MGIDPITRERGWKRDACLVGLLLGLAVLVRVKDLPLWIDTPDVALHDGAPLLTNYDGYYYLGLARDLEEGTYDPVDEKRATPDGYPRPWPPPLLSVLASALSRVAGVPLLWAGALLPVFLGAMIVVPVFLLGRCLAGTEAGVVASALAGVAPYFLARSGLGWFDTDCLNPTFALLLVYFALQMGATRSLRRIGYVAGFVLSLAGFFWWWDSTPETVTVIAFGTLGAAAVAVYRPSRRGWVLFGLLVAGLVGSLVVWQGGGFFARVCRRIPEYLGYVSKGEGGVFPNVGVSIGEQLAPGLLDLCVKTAGSVPGFVLGGVGLGWLFMRDFRRALVLAPLLVVGALSGFAERFIVFLSPLCALGVGVLASRIRRKLLAGRVVVGVVVAALLVPPLVALTERVRWPTEAPWLVAGLERIAERSPSDAVVWSLPDLGYMVEYFSRRATIGDGSVHGGERTVYASLPYASADGNTAADFIRYYALRGMAGVREAFLQNRFQRASSIGALPAAEKGRVPPVYLLADWRMLKSVTWWYWFGTWDPRALTGVQPYREWHKGVRVHGFRVAGEEGWEADLERGVLRKGRRTALLDRATIHTPEGSRRFDYHRPEGLGLRVYTAGELAVAWDVVVDRSVFARLFFDGGDPSGRFVLVDEQMPAFRLFRVGPRGP